MGLYRRAKVWFNYRLDRLIDHCSSILLDDGRAPGARRAARVIGDAAWLLRDLPRLPAYRLAGRACSLVFVGREHGLLELSQALFGGDEAGRQELNRVALWRLPAHARQWLNEGVDLVVCESSRIFPWHFEARFVFSVPIWVQQVLPIPDALEQLLTGYDRQGIRHNIARAQRDGFGYRFSRDEADFELFYHRMYLPFISARHGALAMITDYDRQKEHRFKRGGLLLITRQGEPVAGSLCYIDGETCYSLEGGVLDNDPDIIGRGINALHFWYTLQWAREQGAKVLNMGGSHAWTSNPAFGFKRRWRSEVTGLKEIRADWRFLAGDLSAAMRERLNAIGFISEIQDRHYLVQLHAGARAKEICRRELDEARKQGLAGVIAVSPGASLVSDCA